jgi:8-oxo-dGTP diphosphatase
MLYSIENLCPGLSVDCVVFGFEDGELKVLLLKWKQLGYWALPGGHIFKNEDIDNASQRVLNDRTGLENVFLNQFRTFGEVNRLDGIEAESLEELTFIKPEIKSWFQQRFVTIGYLALLDIKEAKLTKDDLSDEIGWISIHKLPELVFDHQHIVQAALDELKLQLNYLPIGINLLPKKFTMGDLQKLYENVLGKTLDRANFQKKILKLDILERLEKKNTGKAHKAPYLYRFAIKKYLDRLNQGIGFV